MINHLGQAGEASVTPLNRGEVADSITVRLLNQSQVFEKAHGLREIAQGHAELLEELPGERIKVRPIVTLSRQVALREIENGHAELVK